MPDDLYTKYTICCEQSSLVKLGDGFGASSQYNKSNFEAGGKLWSFYYAPDNQTLNLEMQMHHSDSSKTVAECIFWYWNDKKVAILQKIVHTFGQASVQSADSREISRISVPTNGAIPVNKKFEVVIRLLDKRIACANNSLKSYYANYEGIGIETVTLNIIGTKKASFIVPKIDLVRASPVFRLMFANEMKEWATGKVEIADTNPEDFGDFLKAISPKQKHPTPSNVFALLKLADRYQIQLLRDRCELHLMNCIEIPLIHRLTCANFYGLNKLKNNLMERLDLDGTGLLELLQCLNQNFDTKRAYKEKEAHMNGCSDEQIS